MSGADSSNSILTHHQTAPDRGEYWRQVVARLEWAFIFFCLYVAAFGPLFWRWHSSVNGYSSRFLLIFYTPLWLLAAICPPFYRWLMWYIDLWNF
ncbi:hypothetical protein [Planctomicrobium sp. SH664]|uniref:hypothetical protein n=1 Tax=Planctomicrobium sp. SH664 TaxID=3448125 RepID=UPI003F5BC45D